MHGPHHDHDDTNTGTVGRTLVTDTNTATGPNVLAGAGGADTFYATASGHPADQIHLYGAGGNDTFHLNLSIADSDLVRHGHHVFTGSGADKVNFQNVSNLRSTIVGRLDDLSSADSILIDGHVINLNKNGTVGAISYHVVSYQGQQWLEMTNNQGGRALYALEGARQVSDGHGGFTDEAHFLPWNTNIPARLQEVRYYDSQNTLPAYLDKYFDATHNLASGLEIRQTIQISGGGASDVIITRRGDDVVSAGRGHDAIDGFMGNDTIVGGEGNDLIKGDKGFDRLRGDEGHDVISGGSDADTISGGAGNDVVWGGSENDILFGDAGEDRLYGGAGNDYISGGSGRDVIEGGEGDDKLVAGDAVIDARELGDTLSGGTGNDVIRGGGGQDEIRGGAGNDAMWGGGGNDTFVFSFDNLAIGREVDVIADFKKGDVIDLTAFDATAVKHFTGDGETELMLTRTKFGILISADEDGDAVADHRIFVYGSLPDHAAMMFDNILL